MQMYVCIYVFHVIYSKPTVFAYLQQIYAGW